MFSKFRPNLSLPGAKQKQPTGHDPPEFIVENVVSHKVKAGKSNVSAVVPCKSM